MTDYTITTDFGAKDSLPSGNAAKVIKGSEFTTEFTNIKTAVNSKADTAGDTFTGAVTFDAAVTLNADVTFDTNTMFVDVSENRVGIGNVAPATALDVTGTVTASGLTVDTNTLHVDATNNRVGIGTTSPLKDLNVSNTTGSSEIMISTADTGTGSLEFGDATSGTVARGFLKYNHSDNSLQLGSAQTERMRIDSSGKVGIGTTSPSSPLHIFNSGTASGSLSEGITLTNNSGSTNNRLPAITWDYGAAGTPTFAAIDTSRSSGTGGNLLFHTASTAGSLTERLRIDASGNVGIGTDSPATKLHVQSGGEAIRVNTANENTHMSFGGTRAMFGYARIGASDLACIQGSAGKGIVFCTDDVTFGSGEKMRIVSSGNVGIGTSSPDYPLEVSKAGTSGTGTIGLVPDSDNGHYIRYGGSGTNNNVFRLLGTGNTERMRIDTSGNLLVGTTDTSLYNNTSGEGFSVVNNELGIAKSGTCAYFNRMGSDGENVKFFKDGSTVGSIGTVSNRLYIGSGNTFITFYNDGNAIYPAQSNGTLRDNAIDIGTSSGRFDDIYATNGTIQTSDRNEKQGIRELLDAEQRVAVAAKGLLRAFKWNSAVEEKGDEARIHFGIIAQDLQDAFTAEGLDAGDYAMFINSTWTDEETGEERSRMGVRYSELLAFIISAI